MDEQYFFCYLHTCRSSLHSFANREKRSLELASSATSSVNYRFLTTPERNAQLLSTKKETRALKMRVKRLELKLTGKIEEDGIVLDDKLSIDICQLMDDHDRQVRESCKEDTFQYVFWRQQREAMGRDSLASSNYQMVPLSLSSI